MTEEIWHHGIKGMHWGVRRTPEQLGGRSSGGAKTADNAHPDHVRAHDSKNVRNMSDAELRSRLNRINMERQYAQLNPSSVQLGRKAVGTVIATFGTIVGVSSTVVKARKNWNTISGWFNK